MAIAKPDRTILRDLAKRVAEISDDPVMDRRRRHAASRGGWLNAYQWFEHNSLRSRYPMALVFPEGSWEELLPDSNLRCTEEPARQVERELCRRIYGYEHFYDWSGPVVKVLEQGKKYNAFYFSPINGEEYDLGAITADASHSWQAPRVPLSQDWVLVLEHKILPRSDPRPDPTERIRNGRKELT